MYQILRAASVSLHLQQSFERNYACGQTGANLEHRPSGVLLGEIEWFVHEVIDRRSSMLAPKFQSDHPLVAAPIFPGFLIREIFWLCWYRHLIADLKQRVKTPVNVVWMKLKHYIYVTSKTNEAMGVHRKTIDDEVLHSSCVQRADNSFDAADFHAARPSRNSNDMPDFYLLNRDHPGLPSIGGSSSPYFQINHGSSSPRDNRGMKRRG